MLQVTRSQALASRVRAQQLDREAGSADDADALDLGVQDTGPDGGLWALAIRGVVPADSGLATVWTVRGAPHLYRRADLPQIAAATAPFSDADAGKRIFDASKPLQAAGIGNLEALDAVASTMRSVVREPTVKGVMSRRVADLMPAPYLRHCRPCDAVHLYEQPFRLAALRAGLELVAGTSPPVLQPIPDFAPAPVAGERFDVVRGYLRLLGPATPQDVAGYLDAPVKDVRARWPADAVVVSVDGRPCWALGDLDGDPVRGVRLLGPFDPFLQARDRTLLVPDRDRQKELWPVLGRPGGVLADGELAGTWRAAKKNRTVAVTAHLWSQVSQVAITEQAERLAAYRGLELSRVAIG
ncbi:winged helix DNA-binding domain-containing protein [Modestobacter sp. I12A-02628]|uniref:Winged helix DNA-binding domain-containing protein n=1 Tax=Goekera deserti TaxID=2497753 RepID=A0A7K3WBY9_9ACTN|nr:winged helix DNA-binding domain-containing protein [Goekera deserti]MPQ98282.1 winged helix DNA-binding domain-containing protein [Goekera deserti]NDI48108.1 winged helix DNA-binding domain-containing protein [Goekera deserti]NEL53857.1 winged helix DNA-binding domain-containing protein [Goekera deserti]